MTGSIKITELANAGVLDGTERVPIVQDGISKQCTTEQIVGLVDGSTIAPSIVNLPVIGVQSYPADGDIWREDNTNTGLKIRINGTTKTIVVS